MHFTFPRPHGARNIDGKEMHDLMEDYFFVHTEGMLTCFFLRSDDLL